MIKRYPYTFKTISKNTKGTPSDASLLCVNVGNKFAVLLILFLTTILPNQLYSQCATGSPTTYTATCTWTCPAGVFFVDVQCWGGGGAGGSVSSTTSNNYKVGGGGGGAYAATTSVPVTPGSPYTITVGAGGTVVSNNNGNAGGASSFATTVIAAGGTGGGGSTARWGGGAGGTLAASTGAIEFVGGNGSGADGGDANFSGAGGGGGDSGGNGGNAGDPDGNPVGTAGAGGVAGAGGLGVNTNNTNGGAGNVVGAGGGGAKIVNGTNSGGVGARGQVILTYCTAPTTQATTFTYGSITGTTMTLGWTRGNGNNVLIIAKATSAPTDPTLGTTYTGNAAYGAGTAVGGGFAVHAGTSTSVALTGLASGTTYHFAAYEYNTTGSCYNLTELSGNATTLTPYKATFTAMSVGSANWCVNEVRNVTVTVTNSGTATWTDASPQIRIGAKMVASEDYIARVAAGGLAAGASRTYTLTVTALATSTNVMFNVVNEGNCWFTDNTGLCGPGNTLYESPAITVNAIPATPSAITGTTSVTCLGTTTLASSAPPAGGSGTWTSSNTAVATVNSINGVVTGVAAGTTTISYYVTSSAGCNSASVNTTVTVPGVPASVTAVASPNPVCTNGTLTLTGGATAGVGAATSWSWVGPNSFSSTSQSPTIASAVAASAGTYSLTATNACGSAAVVTTSAVTVTVTPTAVTASASPNPICTGNTLTLTGGATGTVSAWSWTGPSSFTSTSQSPTRASVTTAHAGTYTLTATNGTCAAAAAATTAAVVVNTTTSITANPSNPPSVNSGAGTATFTVSATGGGQTYQWQEYISSWLNVADGGVYSNATTASLSITNALSAMNNYQYKCVVSGCTVVTSGTATLTVNSAGNATPCYNTTQNYNVVNVAGVTYTWTFPSGWSVVSGQGSNSVNLLVGVNSGSVTVTPSNTCGNGVVRSLAVTVASVSIAASATTICSGTSVTFTATPTGGGASPTYQWTKNGTNITGATATTFTSTVLANTDAIAVKMTSTAGCLITSTAINMVVNPASIAPSVSISASETAICSGVSVTFTAVPVNGGSAPAYQWKVNAGNVGTNSTTYTSTTLANTNTVTVVMTNNDACVSPTTATSNAIVMTVNTALVASSTITASPTGTICGGTSVTFSVSPTNGGTPTYQWRNGASNVGTNSNTYTSTTLANNDLIKVLMTTSLPCTTPSPVTSNTITMVVNTSIVNNTVSAAQVICTGSTPAVLTGTTPTGGNGVYTYLWELSTTSSTAGFATTGVTTYTINPGALTATTWYRRTVTSAPCASNVSDAIKITVNTAIVNNTVSFAQSICSGTSPNPIAGSVPTGGNGVYTYVWALSTTSSTAGFGGSIATSQDFSPGDLTATTWYRRTVSSTPCGSSVSDAIRIFINANLAAGVSIAASATSICTGTSVVFTPTPTNGGTAPTYQWTKNGFTISGETFNTYTTSTLANSDAIRVVMTSNASPCLTGSPATSAPVTMTVNNIPVATATNSSQTKCSGVAITAMTFTTSPGVTGTTFAWSRDNTGSVTGIAASASGVAIGGGISGTLTNTTTSAVTVTFTITPTGPANTNCAGSAITATVLVNPGTPAVPGTVSGIANTYAGFVEPYSIAAVSSATSYTWAVPTGWAIASGQGTTAIKATAGSAGQNGNVTVTTTNACGTSAASTYPVTVTANTTATTSICEGTTQTYTTQYREGVTYTWSVPADWTIVSGAGTNSIQATIGATSGNVQVTTSNSCGDGTGRTLAITANPLPVMTSAISAATCSGVALSFSLTATPASTFSWEAYDRATTTGESDSPQTTSIINDVITTTATVIDTVIYKVKPTSTAGCAGGGTAGSLSPQLITVRINPSNHWTGNAGDRKWGTVGNWCVVPICGSDAFIPTSPTGGNFPQVASPDAICRSLTISTGASLELLSNNLALCGNWVNNGTFTPATYKITFQGTANQTVGGSVASNTFYQLQISNSGASGSDNVTLTKPASVTNVLNLSDGILVTSSTNLLTLTNSANTATNGGSAGSYVSGPMRWNGLTGVGPFIFPTGKGSTKWARIGIRELTAATDFTAEYFNTSYTNVGPSFMATTPTPVLTNVSSVEYWNFDRVSGIGEGKVSLYWENATWSGITDCVEDGNLQIAHWDSGISKWENNNNADDIGAGSTCGGSTAGFITTTAVVNEFSPFTFGNKNPLVNPLPVELLYFNAVYNGTTVDATWSTASEINNDYFTVERSLDGVNFIPVGVVVPSQAQGGNSTSILSYGLNDDEVAPGIYYYRLKQTDFNGEFQYSNMDVVEIKGRGEFGFTVYPNPTDGTVLNSVITADKDQEIVIVVYDILGQEIYSKIIVTEQKGNTVYAIDLLQKLSSGVYMITATSNQKIYTKRLVVN